MIYEASKRWTMTVVAATLPLALSACATPKPIDAASPIAGQVSAAAAEKGSFPKFSQVPSTPTDVRTPKAWKDSVVGVETAGAKLQAETAPSTFTLSDTDTFAQKAHDALAGAGQAPGEEAARQAADAFARTARERATPPPSKR
jgi:hypothetical protein